RWRGVSDESGARLFSAARWAEVRALVDRLDPLATGERRRELDTIAAVDAGLAALGRAMLERGGGGGAGPPQTAVDHLVGDVDDDAPAQVGPFRLVERIGAGGMGVVYLAERSGTDFTQRVALKLLDGNAARSAHFAARERRILAALAHPNITAFVDAGS